MSTSLYQQSFDADSQYGLAPGTTYAIAGTESSYGANLGSRGNIFQFGSAETQQYGDGNSPYSAAKYFSALLNGPAQGNYAVAYTMYQNGATGYANGATTPQYSSTSPFAQFLQSFGYPATGSDIGSVAGVSAPNGLTAGTIPESAANTSYPNDTTGLGDFDGISTGGILPSGMGQPSSVGQVVTPGQQETTGGTTPSGLSWLQSLYSKIPSPLQISGGLLALILITVGLIALILDKHPVEVAIDTAKKAI